MWCDPNYYDKENPYQVNKGAFSVIRRCFYGKVESEYVFEYSKDSWQKYKNNKKFARLSFIEGHEITGEVINLDKPLYKFLNGFIKEEKMNNTSIIIASDHGLHYRIYVNSGREDTLIENFLSVLKLLLLIQKNNKIKLEELYKNQDKFITPYDNYNTMFFIAKGKSNSKLNSNYGNSLIGYINPKGRNFTKYREIKPNYCQCIIKK